MRRPGGAHLQRGANIFPELILNTKMRASRSVSPRKVRWPAAGRQIFPGTFPRAGPLKCSPQTQESRNGSGPTLAGRATPSELSCFPFLFPEQPHEKRQQHAQEEAGDDGKINAEVAALIMNVARQPAQP